MKFLVLSGCISLASCQGFYGLEQYPDGSVAPVDEPVVAMAKANHLAAKFSNGGSSLPVGGYGYPRGAHLGGVLAGPAIANSYPESHNMNTPLIRYPNGAVVPHFEPDVAAARANLYRPLASYGTETPYRYEGPLNMNTHMVAYPNGALVPLDEPSVAAARADHFSAGGGRREQMLNASPSLSQAPHRIGNANQAAGQGTPFINDANHMMTDAIKATPQYEGPLNLNTEMVAHPNGAVVPLDEPSVAAARAQHFAAGGGQDHFPEGQGQAQPFLNASPLAGNNVRLVSHPVPAVPQAPFFNNGYPRTINLNNQQLARNSGPLLLLAAPNDGRYVY